MRKLFIIFVVFAACIEPYDLEVKGTQRTLVIEANMTNLPGRQFVQLEYSYSLEGQSPELVAGAVVEVEDDLGNRETFIETSPGRYIPNGSFTGVVGRKYQLFIQTPDGKQYRSSEEQLLEPGSIANIYGRFLSLRSETSDGFENGVQFLIDVDEADEGIHNYRFEYIEDYEIRVPYESFLEFNPSTGTIDRRSQPLGLCYVNEKSKGLLIATTSSQERRDLLEFPLVFIGEDESDLLGRYSLSILSYRISGSAYQYYSDLLENNESGGSFFDRQKGAIIGNIRDVNDPTAPVLGYFEVAGISEDYEIFSGDTWTDDGYDPMARLQFCRNLLDTIPTTEVLSGTVNFDDQLIYNFGETETLVPGTTYNTIVVLAPNICSDCRLYGTLNKPSFWD